MSFIDLNTAVGHSFGIDVDGIVIKGITEISGLKWEQDVIDLKMNTPDGKYIHNKLPGRPKPADITVTRGLTSDNSFEKWVETCHFGMMADARKGASIIIFDYEGTEVKRYNLTNAWPKSLEIGAMKAGDTSVLTEKLVISCEEIKPG
jgi:phage tail-like protein